MNNQVNDWGWKMTVTPVMSKVDPSNLSPPMLDSKLSSLLRICLDCPRDQVRETTNCTCLGGMIILFSRMCDLAYSYVAGAKHTGNVLGWIFTYGVCKYVLPSGSRSAVR